MSRSRVAAVGGGATFVMAGAVGAAGGQLGDTPVWAGIALAALLVQVNLRRRFEGSPAGAPAGDGASAGPGQPQFVGYPGSSRRSAPGWPQANTPTSLGDLPPGRRAGAVHLGRARVDLVVEVAVQAADRRCCAVLTDWTSWGITSS
jgi:hypothetical protein